MRVGYLTYGLDRAPTGIGCYAVELVRALEQLADPPEIVLLTTEQTDCHGLWQRFERHALPGCRLLPALLTVGNLWLSHAARRYQLDLIHDPNGIAPFLGPSVGTHRVVTIHDAFAYVYPEAHNRLDNWRFHTMLPPAAHNADLVLTDSDHSRQDLRRFLKLPGAQVKAIPCAVDAQFRRSMMLLSARLFANATESAGATCCMLAASMAARTSPGCSRHTRSCGNATLT